MIKLFTKSLFFAVAMLLFSNIISAQDIDFEVRQYNDAINTCANRDISLKVNAFIPNTDTIIEDPTYTYKWYYSSTLRMANPSEWTALSEDFSPDANYLELLNVQDIIEARHEGYYFCVLKYGLGSTRYSNIAKVVVEGAAPTIGSVTAPGSICEGSLFEFRANDVQGAINSWWTRNGEFCGRLDVYADSAELELEGSYIYYAYNGCGETTYGPFTIDIVELPRIIIQPRPAALCSGDELGFHVVASGEDLQYQWYYNNAAYEATNETATTADLIIENAQHDPDFYSNTFNVQVSNSCATLTSLNVGTIVSEEPNIVGHPESQIQCSTTEVTLSANATVNYPSDTLAFTWYHNGEPVYEYSTDVITFAMDSAHIGTWQCAFTNGCGTVFGNEAVLSVIEPPVIENHPENVAVCEGEQFQLSVKAAGTGSFTYAWFNDNGEGLAYTDVTIAGIDNDSTDIMTAGAASEAHEHYYYCNVSNECATVISDTAFVFVNQRVSIYPNNLPNLSLCTGSDTVVSIADRIYEGSTLLQEDEFENITFAWYKVGTTDTLSRTPELHFTNVNDDVAGNYVCSVINPCGEELTTAFTITTIQAPEITVQPQDLDVCTGQQLSVSVTAIGDGLRYSWYRNGEMVGSNSSTYTAPAAMSEYGGEYYCQIRSEHGCAEVLSEVAIVTVGTNPVITAQPTPALQIKCEDESYDLTMAATGDGIHFQWYNNGQPLAGQTTNSLHIENVTTSNDGGFYCIVSNGCDEVRSDIVTLEVNAAPELSLGPDLNPCRGETITLGDPDERYDRYVWNNGTWGYTPTINIITGGTYILEVSDSAHGNCLAHDTIIVNFHDIFEIEFDSTPIVTCGEITLNAGDGAAQYLWSTMETTSSVHVVQSGNYMVTVDGTGHGCTSSMAVNVTIGEEIVINLGPDLVVREDTIIELSVPAVFEAYRWNTGATTPSILVDGNEEGIGQHTFWLEVTNSGCYAKDTIVVSFVENIFVEQHEMPQLSLYPNPATNSVNIVSANGEMNSIQLYDITGRLLVNQKVNSELETLNVEKFSEGTYVVRVIYADERASISKLVIEK